MPEEIKIWQVSELSQVIRELLEDAFFPFWISGEVGNLTIHRSGHVYFTLKDAQSQINCVYFSAARIFQQYEIKEGTEVELYGNLTLYAARGSYQINVQRINPKGVGALMLKFEELKQKLLLEGLFDETRKKPIPKLPQKIAVITSPEGAALFDFLNVINRRFANTHIRIFPAAVQGKNSAVEIANQVNYCNQINGADVIIITRGGGSLEDLWSFNEEIVARAVYASKIPVISAVGHEVDFTICDFVADLRVPTPSAAAELVIGQKVHFIEQIENFNRRLQVHLQHQLRDARQRLQLLANSAVLKDPLRPLTEKKQLLDEYQKRLEEKFLRLLEVHKNKLLNLQTKIQLLNPQHTLDRGYAIVTVGGEVIDDVEKILPQQLFQVRLAKGVMKAIKTEDTE